MMREVVIAGIGQIPVGEHWELSLRNISARAVQAAKKDAGGMIPEAIYIGNVIASVASHQANLGALVTDNTFLEGTESYTIEAGEASAAAAFRMAYLAVASGWVDIAMALGMEKYTDLSGDTMDEPTKLVMDYDYENYVGQTLTSQAGLLMQRYLFENPKADRQAFGAFPLIGHANAVNNPNAMFRKAIRPEVYEKAGMVSSPMNMFDIAPYADGAAALILTTPEIAHKVGHPLVRVIGSDVAIDTLALHDRPDPLAFRAAGVSLENACSQAGILPSDVDFFELHDAFSVYGVLSLEAAGFAARGEGWKLGIGDRLTLKGDLPINTMGGLKARGYPLGATGAYQLVEAVQQLRGEAGENQIPNARLGLVQSLGGPASTAVTHVLERMPG
ncbi:MAG: acetyl-CoA acetyltransferase [Chloroflexi bacterium HGW-Chloroflexi-2]|jgi:acetyl-CoA C-acetyltransferase|nr:MAG: acetyl-CoA acetyltransferase [Chloroflexi bacterium HGW-Chloroflexi-2]